MLLSLSPEVIRQHGAEELVLLRQRVLLWQADYRSQAPVAGGEDYLFLVNEFAQEIEEHLYPYIRRLRDTNHLDQTQVDDFLGYCYGLVNDLQDHIMQGVQNEAS
jgi:hypothetical protein